MKRSRMFCLTATVWTALCASPTAGSAKPLLLTDPAVTVPAGTYRATVVSTLRHQHLMSTPIGPVRFDSAGAMRADDFTLYTVDSHGALVQSRNVSTH